jgi:hypothetical protein
MTKSTVSVTSHGSIYGFTPTSKGALRKMQRLFPEAQWLGQTMYAEHRYACDVGQVIEEQVAPLVRAGDGAPITVRGTFVLVKTGKGG